MSRMIRTLLLVAAFGLSNVVLAAQPLKTQTSNKDGVTVKATPVKLEGAVWEFQLVFDTHSQELSDDMMTVATLVGPNGTQVKPTAWNGDPPNGHHRKGVLRFNALTPPPDVIELRIARPKESASRDFKWPMPRQ